MKVTRVLKDTVCDELGFEEGDTIIAFDGNKFIDILDYEYYDTMTDFTLEVTKADGENIIFEIEKDSDERLGLEFCGDGIDMQECHNNCLFCFVNQLPKNKTLRKTLYVKDDDYRHSFISGTYVTLTNLKDADIDRIIRLKLSPIYVSVHSTSHEERLKLLGIKRSNNVMEILKKLSQNGIAVHSQIVYCPGVNDDLEKYINDLSPLTSSLAIVPVGLTDNANPTLRLVTKTEANNVIDLTHKMSTQFLKTKGERYVYCSDEFYVIAGRDVMSADYYEDFYQIENGVGLLAKFNMDMEYGVSVADEYLKNNAHTKPKNVSIATGHSAYNFIKTKADYIGKKYGINIAVHKITNTFFGKSVTVAGLLTATDIIDGLTGKQLGESLLLPSVMLQEFGDMFLDNKTTKDIQNNLGVTVKIIESDGESFVYGMLGINKRDLE